ncbi:hypothetical protein SAMN04487931_10889 [Desulfobacula phenolica]|uniref:Replication initiation factor n=1 Tax=Desulfobacula phenolica TaxID=90732 RepID=A0A1H2IDL5_9BACT|nr:hypothetical protein SAMN04487931_10889 [Desulfobacula phenolica]
MTLHQKNNEGLNNQLIKSCVSNNYLYKFKKIKFYTSIDFIIFSIKYDYNLLLKILTEIMVKSSSPTFYKTPSSLVKVYNFTFNNRMYKIKYIHFFKGNYIWLRIDDPDALLLQHFSNLLHPIQHHVAMLECTVDFYGPNIHTLYSALKSKYVLSHSSRSKPLNLNYDDTEYAGNPRSTKSKALRLYKKEDDNGNIKYARLEIVYKRNWLKNKKIISIRDVLKMDCDTVYQPLKFKIFNHHRFIKNYVRRMEKGIFVCKANILEVLETIDKLTRMKNISSVDKFAKCFISYSCCETHLFETAFKALLTGKLFLNGKIFEMPSEFLFDDF